MIKYRFRPWHVNGYFRRHVVRLGLWLGLCIVRNGLVSKHLTVTCCTLRMRPIQFDLMSNDVGIWSGRSQDRVCHPPIFTLMSIFKPANFLKGTYDMNNEKVSHNSQDLQYSAVHPLLQSCPNQQIGFYNYLAAALTLLLAIVRIYKHIIIHSTQEAHWVL